MRATPSARAPSSHRPLSPPAPTLDHVHDAPLNIEVAVATHDHGEQLGILTDWHRETVNGQAVWSGYVIVFGPNGQYRDRLPADRLTKLIYCGRLPSGEIRHNPEWCDADHLGGS